jgi:hypothetical protein
MISLVFRVIPDMADKVVNLRYRVVYVSSEIIITFDAVVYF